MIFGSVTISNKWGKHGCGCLAEVRTIDQQVVKYAG